MANSKLLKEAIADAKAVKETALANAKLALEEAFTPRLQSILSQKLREEAEEMGDDEAEKMQEELDSSDIGSKVGVNAAENPGKQPSLDANTDLSVGVKSKGGNVGSELSDYSKVKEISEEENPYGNDMEGDKDAEIAELKARLAELEGEDDSFEMDDEMGDDMDDEMDDEEDDMSDEFSMDQFGTEQGDDTEMGDDTEGEDDMDLESIIRELEAQLGNDQSEKEEDSMYEAEEDDKEKEVKNEAEEDDSKEDVIDLEEILREMEADMKDDKEKVDEEEDKEEMKKDLQEAYKTIKSLQSTINEVNLLNAKLLFANKLFRAHNMTNEQKVKVIETLDRTKSVREVKLVYSTLAENFKYTTSSNKNAKKSISEGIASKVVKSTKPAVAQRQVIAESTNFSDRFKKLAGIIK